MGQYIGVVHFVLFHSPSLSFCLFVIAVPVCAGPWGSNRIGSKVRATEAINKHGGDVQWEGKTEACVKTLIH